MTEYVPGWTEGNANSPAEEDVADCLNPVPASTNVTGAPGTAAPLESRTEPVMTPVIVCGQMQRHGGEQSSRQHGHHSPFPSVSVHSSSPYASTLLDFTFHFMHRPFLNDTLPSCVRLTAGKASPMVAVGDSSDRCETASGENHHSPWTRIRLPGSSNSVKPP